MMDHILSRPAGLCLALLVFLTGTSAIAAPVRNKVLEEVTLQQDNGQPVLDIQLSFVFSYLGHFPLDEGRELRIRLKPVRVAPSDRKSVFARESLTPVNAADFAIDEVVYEGDVKEGPRLTVYFDHPVHYHVVPDADYRGIKIFLDPSD